MVADGVHQDAVLDRPEVELDVQPASSATARGRPDLVGQQSLLEVVARLDGAEALGGRLHAVRLGEEVRLPPADRQVADAAGQVRDVRLGMKWIEGDRKTRETSTRQRKFHCQWLRESYPTALAAGG